MASDRADTTLPFYNYIRIYSQQEVCKGQPADSISSLDLTPLVQQWVGDTADNYGFMLQVAELATGVNAWNRGYEKINRAEMVTMLIRGWNLSASNGTTSFMDDADIPRWVKGYVATAEREGIIEGRSNNRFEPSSTATRAEAVAVLVRLLQNKP